MPRQELIVLLRRSRPIELVTPRVREAVGELDPTLPLYDVATMDERMAVDEESTQFVAGLMSLYAVLALLLAGLGVYGVIAQTVERRTREFGVRMALGATRAGVLTMVGQQTLWLVAGGLALGLLGAAAVSRVLEGMLFGVTSRDPASLASAAGVLVMAGLVAGLRPALRAVRLDPLEALRHRG